MEKDFPEGIPECGADALRFGLLAYTVQGRDVNLDIQRVVGYRQFCNKMWNAVRFALPYVSDFTPDENTPKALTSMPGVSKRDSFILNRLNETILEAETNFGNYLFGNVVNALHSFFIYDLCDVYLELIKPVVMDNSPENADSKRCAQATLYTCLETYLRLCHPIMPFVTEELWQRLPNRGCFGPSIMIASYPKQEPTWHNPNSSADMALVKEAINAARSMRAGYKIGNNVKTDFYYTFVGDEVGAAIAAQSDDFCTLAKGNFLTAVDASGPPKGCSVKIVSDKLSILVNLTGVIDLQQEISRLEKDLGNVEPSLDVLERKMASDGYDKVPEKVKEANSIKKLALKKEIDDITTAMQEFRNMM